MELKIITRNSNNGVVFFFLLFLILFAVAAKEVAVASTPKNQDGVVKPELEVASEDYSESVKSPENEEDEEDDEDPPPKKQKQLSYLTEQSPVAVAGTTPTTISVSVAAAATTTTPSTTVSNLKKSKKKNNNMWVTKSTCKGNKKAREGIGSDGSRDGGHRPHSRRREVPGQHLLEEGAPPDAIFFAFPQNESEKAKQSKSTILPILKKKGPRQMQYAASTVMRGSYDSAGIGGNASVTSEQMNNLLSNLNMLEQVGSSEMNRIFTRSQKLNNEAIIDFVKALCKVSMEELRSASDP